MNSLRCRFSCQRESERYWLYRSLPRFGTSLNRRGPQPDGPKPFLNSANQTGSACLSLRPPATGEGCHSWKKASRPRSAWKTRSAGPFVTFTHEVFASFTRRTGTNWSNLETDANNSLSVIAPWRVIMLPSPAIASSTTPFSVKDILKLELQQQSQQHQLHFMSCFGLSHAAALPDKALRSPSPPSCMLAGRDSSSPLSSGLSESEERMSYLNTMTVTERLADSRLPVEMFSAAVQNHAEDLGLETEHEEPDSSKFTVNYNMFGWYLIIIMIIKTNIS